MNQVWVRINHEETGFDYTAGLSRSKFAGTLLVVDIFWSEEGRRVVVMVLEVVEMISLGGCKYWGERDGVMSGMSSCFLEYGMMARIWDGGSLSSKNLCASEGSGGSGILRKRISAVGS